MLRAANENHPPTDPRVRSVFPGAWRHEDAVRRGRARTCEAPKIVPHPNSRDFRESLCARAEASRSCDVGVDHCSGHCYHLYRADWPRHRLSPPLNASMSGEGKPEGTQRDTGFSSVKNCPHSPDFGACSVSCLVCTQGAVPLLSIRAQGSVRRREHSFFLLSAYRDRRHSQPPKLDTCASTLNFERFCFAVL